MRQLTINLSPSLISILDLATVDLNLTRNTIIVRAVEDYLDDFQNLNTALSVLSDPTDGILDWDTEKTKVI